jgi:hypothetical protein
VTADLTAWLRARFDEKQRRILAGWDSDGVARVATMWTGKDPSYTTVASDHGDGLWVADGREVTDARDVRILWDPTIELAEVDAKRRIVDRHTQKVGTNVTRGTCAECGGSDWKPVNADGLLEPFPWVMPWPCPTLRLLALPFAGHPGYREEWKP